MRSGLSKCGQSDELTRSWRTSKHLCLSYPRAVKPATPEEPITGAGGQNHFPLHPGGAMWLHQAHYSGHSLVVESSRVNGFECVGWPLSDKHYWAFSVGVFSLFWRDELYVTRQPQIILCWAVETDFHWALFSAAFYKQDINLHDSVVMVCSFLWHRLQISFNDLHEVNWTSKTGNCYYHCSIS